MKKRALLLIAGIFGTGMFAESGEITMAKEIVLKSGLYEVAVAPRLAYTIRSVVFDGVLLGTPTGFYGAVIAPQSGKPIGSGHEEGGRENVLKTIFMVDGKVVKPMSGVPTEGAKISLYKLSQLDNLLFQTELMVSGDGIVERKRFVTLNDQPVHLMMLYMFCWSKTTTGWTAENFSGKILNGEFDGNFEGSKRWHLQDNIKWAANFDAANGKGVVMYFPDIIEGKGRKAAFWEVKNAYNKFYLMLNTPALYRQGYESPVYTLILKGYNASARDWPEIAASIAKSAGKITLPDLKDDDIRTVSPATKSSQRQQTGTIADAITFDIDFTASLEEVKPRTALGSDHTRVLMTPKPVFDFDTMAHTNMGMLIGEDSSSVEIRSEKNIPTGSGTLEMTLKAYDWEGDDNHVHIFLESLRTRTRGDAKIYLYKYRTSGMAFYVELFETGKKLFLNIPVKDWQKQSWHHIAITYSPGRIALFIDGVKVREAEFPEIKSWPENFNIGPGSKNFGWSDGRTTVSNFTCFDRVLTDVEIRSLASMRLPDLKIQEGAAGDSGVFKEVAAPSSPWFKERPKLGLEALSPDVVLPPWTPVKMENSRVIVWGREYDFSGNSMLGAIKGNQAQLLAAPLSLRIRAEGEQGELVFGSPIILEQAPGRIIFRRDAEAFKGFRASLEYTAEYDGMIFCKMTLVPAGRKIESLSLSIPLSADNAEFIHYVGAPTTYQSQNLPRNSNSMALDKKTGVVFRSGFRTNVWIGNNHRGLLWFAESEQHWWPKDRDDMIEVVRNENGAVELNLRMVTSTIPATDIPELRYEFGLMGTPVKPLPDGWRDMTVTAQYDAFKGDTRGNWLIYWPNEWRYMMLDPDPSRALNVDRVREKVAADVAEGRKIVPYWTKLHFVTRDGEKVNNDALMVQREWSAEPGRPGGGTRQMYRASAGSAWSDYLVWCFEEWGRIMGHIDGVYMDETQPIPNFSAISGGGYDDFNGVRRPTFEALDSRDLIKRITYIAWRRNDGRLPWSMAHCSATHTMQNVGMYTGMLIGEHIFSGYFTRNPEYMPPENDRVYYYSYALPMDRLRAECYWKQWGAVMIWLPCLKDQRDIMNNPATTRDMLSRIMQTDMLVWPLWCNSREVHKTWEFRKEFGIGDEGVTFSPYWENAEIVVDVENVVTGYYKNGNKYLILVSNLNRTAKEVVLKLEGIAATTVKNAETGAVIALKGNSIKVKIPRNDYLALRLNSK